MNPILESELISQTALFVSMALVAASLIFPWLWKASRGDFGLRWTACIAAAAIVAFLAAHFTMPREFNIRVDLVLFPIAMLVVGVQWFVLLLVSATGNKDSPVNK